MDKNNYSKTINKDIAMNDVSETLITLLGLVSTKVEWTFPAIMIGSILTGSIRNNPTVLQITLGSKLGRSKNIITTMQSFGVKCSYDEVLRFKRSAAKAATMERSYHDISDDQKIWSKYLSIILMLKSRRKMENFPSTR